MDLFSNPFYLLEATPRDHRRRIQELAEARSLALPSEVCAKARADLTNPRLRLAAEIAWLPGLGPVRAKEVLSTVRQDPEALRVKAGLPALTRANLYAAAISKLGKGVDGRSVGTWIVELAFFSEEVQTDEVLKLINEERSVAGFPEVTDRLAVEEELTAQRQYYRTAIKNGLNALPPAELITAVREAIDKTTEHGRCHAPLLIDDLVDSYEVEVQSFLGKEEANIEKVIAAIQQAADSDRERKQLLERLETIVRNWDHAAQPIQLSRASRGLRHDGSLALAVQLRDLALHLHNDHGHLEDAQYLTTLIQQVFAEVAEVATGAAQDLSTLQGLSEDRAATARKLQEASKQLDSLVSDITDDIAASPSFLVSRSCIR